MCYILNTLQNVQKKWSQSHFDLATVIFIWCIFDDPFIILSLYKYRVSKLMRIIKEIGVHKSISFLTKKSCLMASREGFIGLIMSHFTSMNYCDFCYFSSLTFFVKLPSGHNFWLVFFCIFWNAAEAWIILNNASYLRLNPPSPKYKMTNIKISSSQA